MKGGAYLALQAFKRAAGSAALPLTFLLTPDEEIGSPTSRALIEAHGRRAAYVLVTKPARDGGKVVIARKGVGRFRVAIEGRPRTPAPATRKGAARSARPPVRSRRSRP